MIDNAFPYMTMDILEQILNQADNPRKLSEYLVAQMRELLGARIVVLLEHATTIHAPEWLLTAICPERKRQSVDCPALYQLAQLCGDLKSANFCSDLDFPGLPEILAAGHWHNAAVLPLVFGQTKYGLLVLLDIIDDKHINSMLQTLQPLSRVIGLVLKNSVLYRSLEGEINTRTGQLIQSELRWQTLTETVPVGVFRVDLDGNYLYVNQKWSDITGTAIQDIIGKHWSSIMPLGMQDRLRQEWQGATASVQIISREFRLIRPEGNTIWVYAEAAPLQDQSGTMIGYVGSITDISHRIQYEYNLRQLNDELEKKVSERTRELQESNEHLQNALAQTQQLQEAIIIKEKLASLTPLVAGVSHELNTPIGNISVLSTALQEKIREFEKNPAFANLDAASRQFMNYLVQTNQLITKSAQFAGTLVHSFKKVVVDRESANCRSFQLGELVEDCLNLVRIGYKLAPWEIINEIQENIELHSFPGALNQVIDNLVRNALIHAFEERQRGRVCVRATHAPAQADSQGKTVPYARILVIDDGAGIPKNHRHKIFDPFFTTRLGSGGSGLGLSITYNLVEQVLGGTIRVESNSLADGAEPEKCGTTFTIDIPCERPD